MIQQLLEKLSEFDALRDDDECKTEDVERQEPAFADDFPAVISDPTRRALESTGISRLYRHQAAAIETAMSGDNVVLESPTASGKTIAFTVPMIEKLRMDRDAHALLLYPMKAVAYDQRRQIDKICRAAGGRLESWHYDGNTDTESKAIMRQNPPRILMTNPEYLHQSFLAYGKNGKAWETNGFLRNLKFLVIDEIHEYRGYFGTHVSLLLRRFLLRLSRLGAHPQLFLCSATCANPKEHAELLTGQSFVLESARDSLRPKRHFAFINPRIPDYNFYDIFRRRIVLAALACFSIDRSVLVFCPSIRFAEKAFQEARRDAANHGLDEDKISLFKADLLAEDKESVQERMQSGDLRIVFTTNALELGIDIGGLDGVILAGFPDNAMAAWQRIGRAGRGWNKDAFVLLYAMNNAFDRFFAANLNGFIQKPLDQIILNPNNEEAIKKHIAPMIYESEQPQPGDVEFLGEAFYTAVHTEANRGEAVGNYTPHEYQTLKLRGSMGTSYELHANGKVVGNISDTRRFREAYIGAIFTHFGKSYRVRGHEAAAITLVDAEPHCKTQPGFFYNVNEREYFDGCRYAGVVSTFYGRLNITENFTGFQLINERSGEIIEQNRASTGRSWRPPHAFWIQTEPDITVATPGGIGALEQFFRIGSFFIIPADRHDTSTHSKSSNSEKAAYLYENYEGGIGIAKKIFSQWHEVLKKGIEIAKSCPCSQGCPNCIMPPRVRDGSLIDKREGILLANEILEFAQQNTEKFSNGRWVTD